MLSLRSTVASRFRVASYNVLSSKLCNSNYYEHCDPSVTDSRYRFKLVCDQIKTETAKGSVICLQEVSLPWAGDMHELFSEQGYGFVTANYGNNFDGYMGTAMAYPLDKYDLVDCEISRVADTKAGGYPRQPRRAATTVPQAFDILWKAVSNLFPKTPSDSPPPRKARGPIDPWKESQRRFNQMIMLRLREKVGSSEKQRIEELSIENEAISAEELHTLPKEFVVGTYHMPCVFFCPPVMTIHSALAAQKMEKFAKDSPFVLGGDWNFKPHDPQYKMMLNGSLDEADAAHPGVAYEGDSWQPKLKRSLESAYASVNGREPAFTNYGFTQGMPEPFVETLDYLFFSSGGKRNGRTYELSCAKVDATPDKKETMDNDKSYPTATEPSDHIMIAADWDLEFNQEELVIDAYSSIELDPSRHVEPIV